MGELVKRWRIVDRLPDEAAWMSCSQTVSIVILYMMINSRLNEGSMDQWCRRLYTPAHSSGEDITSESAGAINSEHVEFQPHQADNRRMLC